MIKRIPLILFCISILNGQWQEINQPDIGTISIILAKGNELFTATNQAQVFTSIDQANSWRILADTMDTQPYGADLLLKKAMLYFLLKILVQDLIITSAYQDLQAGGLGKNYHISHLL